MGLALCGLLPLLIEMAFLPSGSGGGLLGGACCAYALFYPLILGVSTLLVLDAVMPEAWTDAVINFGAGVGVGVLLASLQFVLYTGGINWAIFVVGSIAGLFAAVLRLRRFL